MLLLLPPFCTHITGPSSIISNVILKQILDRSWQGGVALVNTVMACGWRKVLQVFLIMCNKLTSSEFCCCCCPFIPILQSHPCQHPRWVSSEYRPIMAKGGMHLETTWWHMDREKLLQVVMNFCSELISSEFCCCRCHLVPVLQGHPLKHLRWVSRKFQANHVKGGVTSGNTMIARRSLEERKYSWGIEMLEPGAHSWCWAVRAAHAWRTNNWWLGEWRQYVQQLISTAKLLSSHGAQDITKVLGYL